MQTVSVLSYLDFKEFCQKTTQVFSYANYDFAQNYNNEDLFDMS